MLYSVARCPGETTCTLRNLLPEINRTCALFMAGFFLLEDPHLPGKIHIVAHKCAYYGYITPENLGVPDTNVSVWLRTWLYVIVREHARHCLDPAWYEAFSANLRDRTPHITSSLQFVYEVYSYIVRNNRPSAMSSDAFVEHVSANHIVHPVLVTLSTHSSRNPRPAEPPAHRRPSWQIARLIGAVHAIRNAGRMLITLEVTPDEMHDVVRCLAAIVSPADANAAALRDEERILRREYGLVDCKDFEEGVSAAIALSARCDDAERRRCERVCRFVAEWTNFCNRLQTPRTVSFRMDDVTDGENDDAVRFVFEYSLPGEMEGVGRLSVVYTVNDPWPRDAAAIAQMKNPFVFEGSRLRHVAFPEQLSHRMCYGRYGAGWVRTDVCPMSAWTNMVCDYLEHPACTASSVAVGASFSDSCPMSPHPCKRSVPAFRVLDALAHNRSVCEVDRIQMTTRGDYASMRNMLLCNKTVHTLHHLHASNPKNASRCLPLLNEAMRHSNFTLRWIGGDEAAPEFYFVSTTDLSDAGKTEFADFVGYVTRNNSVANDVQLFLSDAGDDPSGWMVGPPPIQSTPAHVRGVRLLDSALRHRHGTLFRELTSRMDAHRIQRLRNAVRMWYFRLTGVCISSHLDVAPEQLWAAIFRFLSIEDVVSA